MGILERIEDKFLDNRFVEDKWPEDVYYSIHRFFGRIDDNFYRPFKNYFHNLVKYRRFLAQDYWFDHHYLFEMLRDKLEKDALNYRKYGVTTIADKYADQMEYCVDILNRLVDDEYDQIELKPHDEKWGDIEFPTKMEGEVRLNRPNVHTKEDNEQESSEFMNHIQTAMNKKDKDVSDLFDYMSLHILKWWD